MRKLITALATPFAAGKIDKLSFQRLVRLQLENNAADALLVASTTGEGRLLNDCEKKLLVRLAQATANGVPIISAVESVGEQSLTDAVTAEQTGASALLVAPPSFVKCTPTGYVAWIRRLRKAVSIPLILYNVPARCGYSLSLRAIERLQDIIAGVKDAGKDASYTAELCKITNVLCGNDALLTQHLDMGACGTVSVAANAFPQLTAKVLNGEYDERYAVAAQLGALEINPISIKYMLYKKGIFGSYEMRVPLSAANVRTRRKIDCAWQEYGLDTAK